MRHYRLPIELATLAYFLCYLPYVVLTRKMATMGSDALGRPLTGMEILPAMLITATVFTFVFIWLTGWGRDVTRVRIGPLRVPLADRWTAASGVFTALILVTVPLSYTFHGVSIPLIQLLMRGDVLIIAPIVDLVSRRRVRWWSWTALVLVGIGLFVALFERGGLKLPPLAIAIIIIYTGAYFGRLFVMSRVSKDDDVAMRRKFFSEEKIVSLPLTIVVLAIMPLIMSQSQSEANQLQWGFVDVWQSDQLGYITFCGVMIFLTGIFSALVLLDARENSFCVPLERSASILAGIFGSVILAIGFGATMPSYAEFFGACLLIVALVVLSVGPQISARNARRAEKKLIESAAAESPS